MSRQVNLDSVLRRPSASRRLSKLKRFLSGLRQDGPDSEQIHSLIGDLVQNGISAEAFVSRIKSLGHHTEDVQALVPLLQDSLPLLQEELHQAVVSLQHRYPFGNQDTSHCQPPSPIADSQLPLTSDRRVTSPQHQHPPGLHDKSYDYGQTHNMEPSSKRPRLVDDRSRSPRPGPEYDVRGHEGRHVTPSRVYSTQPPLAAGYTVLNGVTSRPPPAATIDQPVIDTEVPPSRLSDWDSLVSMMGVIHAMVEKLYQALSMLREVQHHDRQQWLAYIQRQREEIEQEMSGRTRRAYNGGGMTEADTMARRVDYIDTRKTAIPVVGHSEGELVGREAGGEAVAVRANQTGLQTQRAEARGEPIRYQQPPREEEANLEACWNCGREASETCSRCKKARYCGVTCQRADWRTNHHVHCRPPSPAIEESSQSQATPGIIVNGAEHPGQVAIMAGHSTRPSGVDDGRDVHHTLPVSETSHT